MKPIRSGSGLLGKMFVLLLLITLFVIQRLYPDKDCIDHPEKYANISRADCLKNPNLK